MVSPAEHWFRIITELERHLSLRKIADVANVSHQALLRYKAGEAEPLYSVGETLNALHRAYESNDPHLVR